MPRTRHILTNTGHPLSVKEDKYITKYLELGNGTEAVKQAGFATTTPEQYSTNLLNRSYIVEEIKFRRNKMYEAGIASAQEVMDYLTRVMRGEILDQFGLEAPLSERTKAAQELAKRTIDIDNRMAGKKDMSTPEIQIKLDWSRNKEDDQNGKEEDAGT